MSTKRLVVLVAVVVGAFALTLTIVVLAGDDETAGYGSDTKAAFIDACTADGGDDVEPACECWYAAIEDEIPYDRFESVNAKLAAQREKDPEAPIDFPDDFAALLEPCRIAVPVTATTAGETAGDEAGGTDTAPPEVTEPDDGKGGTTADPAQPFGG